MSPGGQLTFQRERGAFRRFVLDTGVRRDYRQFREVGGKVDCSSEFGERFQECNATSMPVSDHGSVRFALLNGCSNDFMAFHTLIVCLAWDVLHW